MHSNIDVRSFKNRTSVTIPGEHAMWHIGMFGMVPLYLLWTLLGNAWSCPPAENIAPACTCLIYDSVSQMLCSGFSSPEELIPPIKATDSYDIYSLDIHDSSLVYIPNGLFKNTKYRSIMFVDSEVMGLTESGLAFEGLEDYLEDLKAIGMKYVTQWDWSSLREQRSLQIIDIHKISMHRIDEEFPALRSLTNLAITKAEISFLHPNAFAKLEKLGRLILRKNEITDMSRSMLPESAKHLFHIDLSHNHLTSLPNDFFSNLPSLEEIHLSFNKFSTLNEETFGWPFEKAKTLFFMGNDFRCDCRLLWLTSTRKPTYFEAKCAMPENLKDEKLRYLSESNLWC